MLPLLLALLLLISALANTDPVFNTIRAGILGGVWSCLRNSEREWNRKSNGNWIRVIWLGMLAQDINEMVRQVFNVRESCFSFRYDTDLACQGFIRNRKFALITVVTMVVIGYLNDWGRARTTEENLVDSCNSQAGFLN